MFTRLFRTVQPIQKVILCLPRLSVVRPAFRSIKTVPCVRHEISSTKPIPSIVASAPRGSGTAMTYKFNTQMRHYLEKGQYGELWGVLEQMNSEGVEPDVYTYNAVIKAFMNQRKLSEALSVLQEMEQKGVKPDAVTFTSLLAICVKVGENRAAYDLFQKMQSAGVKPTLVTLSVLMQAGSALSDLPKCIEVMQMIRELNLIPTPFIFHFFIMCCSKIGDLQMGLAALNEMKFVGMKPAPSSFGSLMFLCVKLHRPDIAYQLFEMMKEQSITGDEFVFASLLRAASVKDDIPKIEEILKEVENAKIVMQPQMLRTLLNVYCRTGHLDRAEEILEQLFKVESPTMVHFTQLIRGAALIGDFERAVKYVVLMREKHNMIPNDVNYSAVLEACAFPWLKHGDREVSVDERKKRLATAVEYVEKASTLPSVPRSALQNLLLIAVGRNAEPVLPLPEFVMPLLKSANLLEIPTGKKFLEEQQRAAPSVSS